MTFSKLHKIVSESFFQGVEALNSLRQSNYVEIFKNPSKKELIELSGKGQTNSIRGIITDRDAYMWKTDLAYHFSIKNKLRIDGVTVHILYDSNFAKCYIDVTDNTKATPYYHKPLTQFLTDHPYLRKFKILGVTYFDEDIVGSWDKMAD